MSDTELRDKFAAAAMQSLLAGDVRSAVLLAADAYKVADAMLIERARNNTLTTTLTDEERETIERASVAYDLLPTVGARQVAAKLRDLLTRLSPPAT
jgi:hypothetical protein